ncbi:MAG: tRNA (guanosine(37)-N1)-methyltransferase TrmD [Acetatifactor sp.]|nr:tRNA (guanosine(37)-N1)-methyltransferase TrmD [Acetatifactor sp.]
MKFHILTLFPEMVRQGLETSIIGRAVDRQLIELNTVNIRDFTQEKHGRVDDYPYGGGAGMLMQAQPVFDAWKSVCGGCRHIRTVYVTPQGETFNQRKAQELAGEEELIILCGHYEGIDERVLEETVTDYISIGDYVLTGGELAAMVIVDAVARLVPGVLGNETSAEAESFHGDLLEYPQYSRPEVWHGKRVPEVLLSGNHGKVNQWRLERAIERTAAVRPDLYQKYEEKQAVIRRLAKDKRNHIHIMESLGRGRGEILYRKGEQLLVEDREAKTCMLLCGDDGDVEELLSAIPEQTKWCVVIQERLIEELKARSFGVWGKCSQYLYTAGNSLTVRHKDIRRLGIGDLDYISEHYSHGTTEYMEGRILNGVMYGAFSDDRLIGFIGTHDEGSMGMLYVDEQYRRQGIGEALLSYNINRTLERGWIPYGHVLEGNTVSERLLEKPGLYKAGKPVWWMEVLSDIL